MIKIVLYNLYAPNFNNEQNDCASQFIKGPSIPKWQALQMRNSKPNLCKKKPEDKYDIKHHTATTECKATYMG